MLCELLIANAQGIKYTGPTCIAEFCFDKQLMKESEFIKQYGPGFTVLGLATFHCYAISEENGFVQFKAYDGESKKVISIFVSDVASCRKTYVPKKPFATFATKEGLKLGAPYKKVIDIYGQPSSTERGTGLQMMGLDYKKARKSAPFGDTVLNYLSPDQLLNSFIYIRNEKVTAISISRSP